MNRGGLAGARWELDDRFTAYDAEHLAAANLDGGKVLLRIDDDDPATAPTLEACAQAVTELADRDLVAMIEPLPYTRDASGKAVQDRRGERLVRAVTVASGLGSTAARTWLKVPATDADIVLAASTLPTLLLGGAPAPIPTPRSRRGRRPYSSRPSAASWSAAPSSTRRTATSPPPSPAPPPSSPHERGHTRTGRRADALASPAHDDALVITPESAGWTYRGLAARAARRRRVPPVRHGRRRVRDPPARRRADHGRGRAPPVRRARARIGVRPGDRLVLRADRPRGPHQRRTRRGQARSRAPGPVGATNPPTSPPRPSPSRPEGRVPPPARSRTSCRRRRSTGPTG